MNHHIQDNRVDTFIDYMKSQLDSLYSNRDSSSIIGLLFESYKGWKKADLILNKQERLSESEILQFHFALKRLLHSEPIQYVLGTTYFFGLQLRVNPSVLIPRPETEELVRLILNKESNSICKILDIGTGSGCIPIAIKSVKPDWDVFALDISINALMTAEQSAIENNAEVCFEKCDILKDLPFQNQFDVIVSNPPYVLESDKKSMSEIVLNHEPSLALFVEDNDALKFYKRILEIMPEVLNPGGRVYFEIHEEKSKELLDLCTHYPTSQVESIQDLQGKDRFIQLTYSP